MQNTTNYGLKKPDGTDAIKISDINGNFDILDAKVKAIEGKTETIPSSNGTMQGNLNADMLDGYHAASFALKDGNAQTNLNADLLDGKHAASFALKDGTVQTSLNADLLDGKHATDFALKDGTAQINLNADLLDGKHAGDFALSGIQFNQDSTDLNSFNSNKTWSARVGNNNGNRPTILSDYTTVLNIGSDNNSNFQMAGTYDGSNKLGYRCRHDSDGVYGAWKRILNEDDYNSLFQFASNGKSAIANAITGKGGSANNGMSFDQLANIISSMGYSYKVTSGTCPNLYYSAQQYINLGYRPTAIFINFYGNSHTFNNLVFDNDKIASIFGGMYFDFAELQEKTKSSWISLPIDNTGFTIYALSGDAPLSNIKWYAMHLD